MDYLIYRTCLIIRNFITQTQPLVINEIKHVSIHSKTAFTTREIKVGYKIKASYHQKSIEDCVSFEAECLLNFIEVVVIDIPKK